MAQRQGRSKAGVVGSILALVGGALIALGSVAPWAQSEGVSVGKVAVPGDVRGWEASLGLFAVAAGISAIVLALATLLTPRRATRLVGGGLIIAALVAGTALVINAADLDQTYVDFAIGRASDEGLRMGGVEESIRQLVEIGSLNVDPGLGLWLTAGGAVLVLVGDSLVLMARPRSARVRDDMGFGSAG